MSNENKLLLSERMKNDGKPTIKLSAGQTAAANIFRQDVKDGVYDFEKYNCECGAKYEELITVAEKDSYGFDVSTKICPKCGLVMTNPRMTQQSYDKFYDKICRKIYVGSEVANDAYFEKQKKRGEAVFDYLVKSGVETENIKNVLEIGCSAGGILAGLISRGMTNNVKGIDLDSKYLEFGRKKGLDLEWGHSKDLLARGEKYDLIILSHVLEHFIDIKIDLFVIRQLLSDDGYFYVEVPGLKSVKAFGTYGGDWLRYFQNAHIRHFCRDTLSQVMRWNGFQEMAANEAIRSIYKKTPSQKFDSSCVNYFPSVLAHMQKTEVMFNKRKIYLDGERNEIAGTLTHVTYPFVNNTGDTALSYCVRRTFDSFGGDGKKYSYFLLPVNKNPNLIDVVNKMNSTDGIITGGGGLLLPDTHSNDVSGWQWAIKRETLEKILPPIILYTIGYNYFKGQTPSELFIDNLNAIIEKASFVGLRNTGSVNQVKSLLRDDLKNKVVLQPCTTTIIRKVVPDLHEKVATKKVGVNMAFDRIDRRLGKDKEIILSQVAKAVKKIQEAGYEICYISHLPADTRFYKYLDNEKVIYKKINTANWFPNELFELYNEMDIVLGMRGHAQMIPFGLNTKIISLASHEKMKYFLEDIDALDWLIELTEDPQTLSDRIVDKFQEIQNDKTVPEKLIEKQNKLYQITIENHRQIKEILDRYQKERRL